jgi:hypothetical protein
MERETYKDLPDSNKLDVLLDLHIECQEKIEKLSEKLDKKTKVDTTVSAFFGFVGGALAVLGQKIFLGRP